MMIEWNIRWYSKCVPSNHKCAEEFYLEESLILREYIKWRIASSLTVKYLCFLTSSLRSLLKTVGPVSLISPASLLPPVSCPLSHLRIPQLLELFFYFFPNLTSTLPTSVLGCQVFASWTNYLLRKAQYSTVWCSYKCALRGWSALREECGGAL